MRRARGGAVFAVVFIACSAGAEPLVFVSGATLQSGEIAEILELPGGEMLRAADLIAEFWRGGQDVAGLLVYDAATKQLRTDVEPYLGSAAADRASPTHEWFAYDPSTRGLVPLGAGPIVPAAAGGSEPLGRPGAVLVAAKRAPAMPDQDGDGVPDANDDCILVADGLAAPGPVALVQRDTDADGFGNVCDPDLDGDGIVNFSDLARMKAAFFGRNVDADLDGDGAVNFSDLARMKRYFFRPPGPSGLVAPRAAATR